MSQQVDVNLIELARKWLDKMMPYARFDEQVFGIDVCLTSLSFLWSLLDHGCKVIGVSEHGYAYLRCGGKLVRLELYYCGETDEDIIGRAPPLSEDDVERLIDRKPDGHIYFKRIGINLSVFGDKSVYLGALKNIPLYLDSVELSMRYSTHGTPEYEFNIYIDTESEEGEMTNIVVVTYSLKEDKIKRNTSIWEPKLEETELVEKLLSALNEKYLIMDKLLREASELFTRGFKSILIAFLY